MIMVNTPFAKALVNTVVNAEDCTQDGFVKNTPRFS